MFQEGPTVKDIILFAARNRFYLTINDIKPITQDTTRSILIEEGRIMDIPEKKSKWEDDETDEEFHERLQQYYTEKDKWFKVKEFLFFLGKNEIYYEYRFE